MMIMLNAGKRKMQSVFRESRGRVENVVVRTFETPSPPVVDVLQRECYYRVLHDVLHSYIHKKIST